MTYEKEKIIDSRNGKVVYDISEIKIDIPNHLTKAVVDTNVLLEYPEVLNDYKCIICIFVAEELDGLKKTDGELGYKARRASRAIKESNNLIFDYGDKREVPDGWEITKRDNQIIMCALDNNCKLLSNDLNVWIKSKSINVKCEEYKKGIDLDDIYTGYKEVVMDDYEMAMFYECKVNKWDILENQYLIIKDLNDEVVDYFKWNGKEFINIINKTLKSVYFDDFKAKDVYQKIAIDSLFNNDFTMLFGRAGSGKTLIALSYIMSQIQNGKIGKVYIAFNGVPLRNNVSHGYLPGDLIDKMLGAGLGGILTSKFGDRVIIESLINQGKIILVPTCDIRGMEIGKDDCLYFLEAQNADITTLKTVIQRCAGKLILDGDILEQVDIRNNTIKELGMYRAIEVFKDTKYFGCVKLKNIYRSPIAEIADKM